MCLHAATSQGYRLQALWRHERTEGRTAGQGRPGRGGAGRGGAGWNGRTRRVLLNLPGLDGSQNRPKWPCLGHTLNFLIFEDLRSSASVTHCQFVNLEVAPLFCNITEPFGAARNQKSDNKKGWKKLVGERTRACMARTGQAAAVLAGSIQNFRTHVSTHAKTHICTHVNMHVNNTCLRTCQHTRQ